MARTRFTNPDFVFPGAIDFRSIGDGTKVFEAILDVKGASGVARSLSSRDSVLGRLRNLSAASLACVELLVELGGRLSDEDLNAIAPEALGLSGAEAARGLIEAAAHGIALAVHELHPKRGRRSVWMLPRQSARHIAELVTGVSTPDAPPLGEATASPIPLRDFLALLTTAAHTPVSRTAAGHLGRVPLKKIGAKISVPADEIEDALVQGLRSGYLGMRGELVVPILARARLAEEAATGQRGVGDAWVSVERLARRAADIERWPLFAYGGYDDDLGELLDEGDDELVGGEALERLLQKARAALVTRQDLVQVVHGGHAFVRDRPRANTAGWEHATGDGHVTPSLEVMLGPAAHPRMALEVGAFAELVRRDKVLTFKLTSASVAAGVGLGLTVNEMVAVLARVGRHAVPPNVETMVADFARSAHSARVSIAHVIEASSPEAADRIARELGESVRGRPTATMLLVEARLESKALHLRLAKAGIASQAPVAPLPNAAPDRDHVKVHTEQIQPDASLRRVVQEAKELRATLPDETELGGPLVALRQERARLSGAAPEVRAFVDQLQALWAEGEDRFLDWADTLSEEQCGVAQAAASTAPFHFVPLLVLRDAAQKRLFGRARSVGDLVRRAIEHRDAASLSGPGARLMASLSDRRVQEYFDGKFAELERDETLERARATVVSLEDRRKARDGGNAPAAWTKKSPPKPGDLAPESTQNLKRKLEALAGREAPLWLRVRSKSSGERVVRCTIERLLVRGNDVTVLGTDLDEEIGRSFPLANVVAAVPVEA